MILRNGQAEGPVHIALRFYRFWRSRQAKLLYESVCAAGNAARNSELPFMHIPDGYLSPATCAALYAGSTPFWYTSCGAEAQAEHADDPPALGLRRLLFHRHDVQPALARVLRHAVGMESPPSCWSMGVDPRHLRRHRHSGCFFGDGHYDDRRQLLQHGDRGSLSAWAIYRVVAGGAHRIVRRVVRRRCGLFAINLAALAAAWS